MPPPPHQAEGSKQEHRSSSFPWLLRRTTLNRPFVPRAGGCPLPSCKAEQFSAAGFLSPPGATSGGTRDHVCPKQAHRSKTTCPACQDVLRKRQPPPETLGHSTGGCWHRALLALGVPRIWGPWLWGLLALRVPGIGGGAGTGGPLALGFEARLLKQLKIGAC